MNKDTIYIIFIMLCNKQIISKIKIKPFNNSGDVSSVQVGRQYKLAAMSLLKTMTLTLLALPAKRVQIKKNLHK